MKTTIKNTAMIVAGALIVAASLRLFLVPNRIAPGGVSGLATVIHYLANWPTGAIIFGVNLPLFVIAAMMEGWRFVANTLLAVAVMSAGTDYLPLPTLTTNPLIASLFGGVVMGYGLGLVLLSGSNSGGTALLSHLIRRFIPHVSIAWVMFAIDFVVVALSARVFGFDLALHALIALYISSEVMDRVIEGFVAGKSVYIVTDEPISIAQRVMAEVDRGCTRIDARGMFRDEPRSILLCIVKNSRELLRVKRIIEDVDKKAFVFVSDAREVMGEGFVRPKGR
jgi:uncharacterized membrane-anchored protein YitT (DUF2179 family)